MGVIEFTRYVVLQIMASKTNVVDAVYAYFVLNGSLGHVGRIAEMHGLSKRRLRDYIQRCIEKAGSVHRAKIFARYVIPVVKEVVKPIIEDCDGSNVARCCLCGERIPADIVQYHIWSRHRDAIEAAVENIISTLRELCRKCRGG